MAATACEDHEPRTLTPGSGEGRACGICGAVLYPRQHLIECPKLGCTDPLLGVILEEQWIGDAWVVNRASQVAAHATAAAHFAEHHPEVTDGP